MFSLVRTARPWQLQVFSVSVRKRVKWGWILSALARHGHPRGRCLDVGCGVGTLSFFLRRLGGAWTFLEPDEAAAREAEALLGTAVVHSPLQSAGFADGSFDLVTAFDVVEHLERPEAFFREVARVLRPGGLLVITTPAAEARRYFWRALGAAVFGITKEAHGHIVEGFSVSQLAALHSAAGLQTLELTPFSRFFTEGIELAYNGVYRLKNAVRQRTRGYNLALSPASSEDLRRHAWLLQALRLVSPLFRGISLIDHLLPLGPGYEFGIVAKKSPLRA